MEGGLNLGGDLALNPTGVEGLGEEDVWLYTESQGGEGGKERLVCLSCLLF